MSTFWLLAIVDLIPVAFVVYSSPLRGLSRLLAPDTLVVAILYAIFAIRPLYTDRFLPSKLSGSGFYGFIPTLDGQMTASVVGLLLLWSIAAGVLWSNAAGGFWQTQHKQEGQSAGNLWGGLQSEEAMPQHLRPSRAVAVTLLALAFYAAILIQFMGFAGFLAMAGGRSAEAATGSVPQIVMTIPIAGSVAGALLILTAPTVHFDAARWLAIGFCVSTSLMMTSQLGTRRYIIPSVLILATALLMRRPVRARVWHLAVGLGVLIFLVTLANTRAAGARMEGENLFGATIRTVHDFGVRDLAAFFFTSYDTSMYDYIAVLAPDLESGYLKLGLGSGTVGEFFANPFPAALTPFVERSTELKAHLFNYACIGPGCPPNPVISVGGTLFFDWGYLGVVIGGVVVGLVIRALAYRWSRAATMSTSQNIITAVIGSYAMIAARTDTVWAIWWCIYTLIIAAAVLAAMGGGSIFLRRSRSRTDGYSTLQRPKLGRH